MEIVDLEFVQTQEMHCRLLCPKVEGRIVYSVSSPSGTLSCVQEHVIYFYLYSIRVFTKAMIQRSEMGVGQRILSSASKQRSPGAADAHFLFLSTLLHGLLQEPFPVVCSCSHSFIHLKCSVVNLGPLQEQPVLFFFFFFFSYSF